MGHDHGAVTAGGRHRGRLAIALGIAAVVFVLELVGAWITGSLALLADAGHVFTDMFGVALALVAATMAQRPPSLRRTFGWQRLEVIAQRARLRSRSRAGGLPWQLVNRIAVEELEAWYFADWEAVRAAYPRVPAGIPHRQAFRDPDAIAGGTWEAFERVMRKYGYFKGGLAKIEAARAIGAGVDPARSRSRSFAVFQQALAEAVA